MSETKADNFSTDAYGKAIGSRVEDSSGNVKSVRLLGKAATAAGDTNNTDQPPVTTEVLPKSDKKPRTALPKWTAKKRNALKKAVERQKGKANNKGIAWARVVEEMQISRHHCILEWKRLEAEREAQEGELSSSSSSDDNKDPLSIPPRAPKGNKNDKRRGGNPPDQGNSGGDSVVPSSFEKQMLALLTTQGDDLKKLSNSNARLVEENGRLKEDTLSLKKANAAVQQKMSTLESSILEGEGSYSDSSTEVPRERERPKRRSRHRPHHRRKKKSKQITEDDLIRLQNAASQADQICSQSKEIDRLRMLKTSNL